MGDNADAERRAIDALRRYREALARIEEMEQEEAATRRALVDWQGRVKIAILDGVASSQRSHLIQSGQAIIARLQEVRLAMSEATAALDVAYRTLAALDEELGYIRDSGASYAGAASLAAFGIARWRTHGRWTIDMSWHRAAIGHLAAGIAWGAAGAAAASALVLANGASPAAWSAAVLVALGVGWVAQTIVGAWTHLVPTIGPGDPALHAAQRATLGRASLARLAAWQAGTALLVAGAAAGGDDGAALVTTGGIVAGATAIGSVGLLGRAMLRASR